MTPRQNETGCLKIFNFLFVWGCEDDGIIKLTETFAALSDSITWKSVHYLKPALAD